MTRVNIRARQWSLITVCCVAFIATTITAQRQFPVQVGEAARNGRERVKLPAPMRRRGNQLGGVWMA